MIDQQSPIVLEEITHTEKPECMTADFPVPFITGHFVATGLKSPDCYQLAHATLTILFEARRHAGRDGRETMTGI